MNCLVVNAHPDEKSLCHAFSGHIVRRFKGLRHDVLVENLYQDRFDPVLSIQERQAYYAAAYDTCGVEEHARHLADAEALVLVFPTWWFGFPAMLKGWFDRVWVPGVAYDHAADLGPIRPKLKQLKKVLAVTTLGAPWWVDYVVLRRPVKRILRSALLGACAPDCQLKYLSFYKCEKILPHRFDNCIAKIDSVMARWF